MVFKENIYIYIYIYIYILQLYVIYLRLFISKHCMIRFIVMKLIFLNNLRINIKSKDCKFLKK